MPFGGGDHGLERRKRRTLAVALGIVTVMVVLAFASVPLYRKICQVTGWGGATQETTQNPFAGQDFARAFTIRFNADTDPRMPWEFRPDQLSVKVKVGENGFASFTAHNEAGAAVTGTAVYNVTPLKAARYFYKTQCFCFGQQTLKPGQTVHMPVVFFIDPKIMDDRDLRDVDTLTLSYTFYETDSPALDGALEKFMEKKDTP